MELSESLLKKIYKNPTPGKRTDVKNLVLTVGKKGTMSWQTRLRYPNGEQTYSHGTYPTVSLQEARKRHAEVLLKKEAGLDPVFEKKQKKEKLLQLRDHKFEQVAKHWFTKKAKKWSAKYADKVWMGLEKHVFPTLGHIPVAQIQAPEILRLLEKIEARGHIDTAHTTLSTINLVLNAAHARGYIQYNPAAAQKTLLQANHVKHMPAITSPKELAKLLNKIDAFSGTLVVRFALRLLPLVFLRPGELRQAEWSEIDFEAARWNVPAVRMKVELHQKENGDAHIVPLSKQAIALLRELHQLTGRSRYLFPSQAKRVNPTISENTLNKALRSLGYDTRREVTGHGFRATARTLLDERLKFQEKFIECQLAHTVKDPNGRAYNRTAFLDDRTHMMQVWADYLEQIKKSH